ncbi:MAG: polysaccharide biosynthesis/export family protein [candidate division Zixibacteria bacterium]|nr:polysaccharide biosynthesis/export family protein [candidate division Zixibacteria bacterium]
MPKRASLARRMALLALTVWLGCSASGLAAEYLIGPEDMLEIRFWQQPNLNSTVKVTLDGMIAVDIVGEMAAAGKTTEELQNDIVRRVSRLNKNVSQALVRVTEYNYQHVFVTGHVNEPGKKTFEEIPDIVTIINEAGWITEFGDLSRVTIIRGADRAGEVEVVDVGEAIALGNVGNLPAVYRQDAIDVPSTPAGIPSADIGRQATKKNMVYILGAVNTPGQIQFMEDMDVLEAMALAGGPADNANLSEARVITRDGFYGQMIHIDLDEYIKTGTPARYTLRKEDALVIPAKRGGFFGSNIGTIATVLGVVTSAVLLYETLKPEDAVDASVR